MVENAEKTSKTVLAVVLDQFDNSSASISPKNQSLNVTSVSPKYQSLNATSVSPENQFLNATADETITEIVPPIFPHVTDGLP